MSRREKKRNTPIESCLINIIALGICFWAVKKFLPFLVLAFIVFIIGIISFYRWMKRM